MTLLSKLIKHTVKLPISVVKDVLTLGGVLTDEEESALKKQLKEFEDDMNREDQP